jgi:ankyrin repeat protein
LSFPYLDSQALTITSTAAEKNNHAIIRWFLAHGAGPNIESRASDRTPVSRAAWFSTIETTTLLLENGGDPTRGSVLHAAVRSPIPGRLEMLNFLIDHGAPVNAIEYERSRRYYEPLKSTGLGSALHAAVSFEKPDMAAALLRRGADRELRDTKGRTALEYAEERMPGNNSQALRAVIELLRKG